MLLKPQSYRMFMSVLLLQAEFDAGLVDLSEFDSDVHVVTGVLPVVEIYRLWSNLFN